MTIAFYMRSVIFNFQVSFIITVILQFYPTIPEFPTNKHCLFRCIIPFPIFPVSARSSPPLPSQFIAHFFFCRVLSICAGKYWQSRILRCSTLSFLRRVVLAPNATFVVTNCSPMLMSSLHLLACNVHHAFYCLWFKAIEEKIWHDNFFSLRIAH